MASVLMYFTNSTFPVERAVKNERPAFIKTRESSTPYSDDDIFRENVASLHDWVDDFGNRATRQLSELVIYRNDMFSSARKPTPPSRQFRRLNTTSTHSSGACCLPDPQE